MVGGVWCLKTKTKLYVCLMSYILQLVPTDKLSTFKHLSRSNWSKNRNVSNIHYVVTSQKN